MHRLLTLSHTSHTYQPKGIQVGHACTRASIPKGDRRDRKKQCGRLKIWLKQTDRPLLCRTFTRSDPRSEDASSILWGCILHEFRFTPRNIVCCLGNTTLFCRFIIKSSLIHALCEGMECYGKDWKKELGAAPNFYLSKTNLRNLLHFWTVWIWKYASFRSIITGGTSFMTPSSNRKWISYHKLRVSQNANQGQSTGRGPVRGYLGGNWSPSVRLPQGPDANPVVLTEQNPKDSRGRKANMFLPSISMPFDQEQPSGPAGQEALASAGVQMCCWTSQQISVFPRGGQPVSLVKNSIVEKRQLWNRSVQQELLLLNICDFNHRCLSVTTNPCAEHPLLRAVCLVVKSTISLEEIGLANQGQSHTAGLRWQCLQLPSSQRVRNNSEK